jgi:FkbM family methyltransferase
MNLTSFLYRLALTGPTPLRQLATALRARLVRVGIDPACNMSVHGRTLQMPLSHGLPTYLHQHALYDSLPGRLAQALRVEQKALRVVDVGANVGDTPAALAIVRDDRVLAIEPNPNFSRYIGVNWPDTRQVLHLACLCTAVATDARFSIRQRAGTASFVTDTEGQSVPALTLDEVLERHPEFAEPHLIKIDTDGHDFEVIQGAVRTLSHCRSVVLFECDMMGRVDYASAVMRTLALLAGCGYQHVLVYDNLGNLHGRFDTTGARSMANLLFHQCVVGRQYFDIVAAPGPWLQAFYASELKFFESRAARGAGGATEATLADAAQVAFTSGQ